MSKWITVLMGALWLIGCGGSNETLSVDPSVSHAENYREPGDKPVDLHTGHVLKAGVRDEFLIQPREYHAFVIEVPEGQHHYGIEISDEEMVWKGRYARVAWRNVPAAADYEAEIEDLLSTLDNCDPSVAFPACNEAHFTKPTYMGEGSDGSVFLIVYELLKDDNITAGEMIFDKESWEYSILVAELTPAPVGTWGSIAIGRSKTHEQEYAGIELDESFIPLPGNKVPFKGDVIRVPGDAPLPFYSTRSRFTFWILDLETGLVAPDTSLRVDHCYPREQLRHYEMYDIACTVTVE